MKGKQFVSLMIAAVVLSATLAVPIFAQIGEPAEPQDDDSAEPTSFNIYYYIINHLLFTYLNRKI
ncbi:hypothetical protein [Candidatus Methanoliparum sp. LAM-1]|uniref:hypothetical protein n=1 Tax=Candidatus Methanoliparum sp. LAM-1 TaxID=2874846 RepID=UPI001E5F7553|nr:hypothetical protein [Candidatus Methanoliparum sp. LAM-1]